MCNKKEEEKGQILFIKISVLKKCKFREPKKCNAVKLFRQALRKFLARSDIAALVQISM